MIDKIIIAMTGLIVAVSAFCIGAAVWDSIAAFPTTRSDLEISQNFSLFLMGEIGLLGTMFGIFAGEIKAKHKNNTREKRNDRATQTIRHHL